MGYSVFIFPIPWFTTLFNNYIFCGWVYGALVDYLLMLTSNEKKTTLKNKAPNKNFLSMTFPLMMIMCNFFSVSFPDFFWALTKTPVFGLPGFQTFPSLHWPFKTNKTNKSILSWITNPFSSFPFYLL